MRDKCRTKEKRHREGHKEKDRRQTRREKLDKVGCLSELKEKKGKKRHGEGERD